MTDDDIPEVGEEWFKKARLRRPHLYKLVGKTVVPCSDDIEGLAECGGSISTRVALDNLSEDRVLSTVFIGVDHDHSGRRPLPLVFETALLGGDGNMISILGRWSTWDEAEANHKKLLEGHTDGR